MPKKPGPPKPNADTLATLLQESKKLRTLAAQLTQRTIALDSRIWHAQARLRLLEEQQKQKSRKK